MHERRERSAAAAAGGMLGVAGRAQQGGCKRAAQQQRTRCSALPPAGCTPMHIKHPRQAAHQGAEYGHQVFSRLKLQHACRGGMRQVQRITHPAVWLWPRDHAAWKP